MNNDNTREVGTIYETYDYDKFIKVKGNRAVNIAHVNRLAKKMDNRFLKELPIVVGPKNKNGKYPILDGQHSGDSRKATGRPIRYIIAKHIRPDDISSMNTDKLNWQDKDYLNKYVGKSNEHYIFYRDMMEEFSCLKAKFSVWTTVLNGVWKRNTDLEKQFKDGLFSITEDDKKEAMGHVEFDQEHFLHKVRKQSKKFKGASNSVEWLEIIDYVYNKYNKKKSNKHLDFDEL